jgi:glycine oxidase
LEPSVWTGLRPGAEKPSIGRYRNTRLWLAYGHYRNGILAAPATAKRVASEIIASLGTG